MPTQWLGILQLLMQLLKLFGVIPGASVQNVDPEVEALAERIRSSVSMDCLRRTGGQLLRLVADVLESGAVQVPNLIEKLLPIAAEFVRCQFGSPAEATAAVQAQAYSEAHAIASGCLLRAFGVWYQTQDPVRALMAFFECQFAGSPVPPPEPPPGPGPGPGGPGSPTFRPIERC